MILAIDVGSTNLRATVVNHDGKVVYRISQPSLPSIPFPGMVEIDAAALAQSAIEVANACISNSPSPIEAIGISTQRGSAVVWDKKTKEPIGPALAWSDLRSVGTCLELGAEGIRLSPNEAASKVAWMIANYPCNKDDVLCGTLDTWLAWKLSNGTIFATDHSNLGVSGWVLPNFEGFDKAILDRLSIPQSALAQVKNSSEVLGEARALDSAIPIGALIGDSQASLFGQGCIKKGSAKATFGTSATLAISNEEDRPEFLTQGPNGCFPIASYSRNGVIHWGIEAFGLSAGAAVNWLIEDLGILKDAEESQTIAMQCESTDGVVAVPAYLGLATPQWDFGARSALLGITAGTKRPQIVRAVLEGVAHMGADLLHAAMADSHTSVSSLRVDGGMSQNTVFIQAVANSCEIPIEVSKETEATVLGAAYLGGLAVGFWKDEAEIESLYQPSHTVEPSGTSDRDRWRQAVERACRWYPELSEIKF